MAKKKKSPEREDSDPWLPEVDLESYGISAEFSGFSCSRTPVTGVDRAN